MISYRVIAPCWRRISSYTTTTILYDYTVVNLFFFVARMVYIKGEAASRNCTILYYGSVVFKPVSKTYRFSVEIDSTLDLIVH